MEKSINVFLTLFDKYKDIEVFKQSVDEHKNRLAAYNTARKYEFISNLVGGKKKYEENLQEICALEQELETLMEVAEKGHTDEEIEKNKRKAELTTIKFNLETLLQSKEMRLRLVNMSLEYRLNLTEADIATLQQYFPTVNLRKLYEVEQYHRKLAKILDGQFKSEQNAIKSEIDIIKEQLEIVNTQIKELGFVGIISKEFLDKHSAITGEINALRTQNQAFLKQKELQEAKANADEVLRRSIEDILREIEVTLNDKMKEFTDSFSLAKLGKDENVTTEVLAKICKELKCDVGDIMEFIPDENE